MWRYCPTDLIHSLITTTFDEHHIRQRRYPFYTLSESRETVGILLAKDIPVERMLQAQSQERRSDQNRVRSFYAPIGWPPSESPNAQMNVPRTPRIDDVRNKPTS